MKGPRPPPAGPGRHLTGEHASERGSRAHDAFTQTQEGPTARRRPDALSIPRETTEARPRRIAPLVTDGGRAIGADKSTIQQHDLSNLHVGSQPTKIPTFPHQKAQKSRYQQHVVSYNPKKTAGPRAAKRRPEERLLGRDEFLRCRAIFDLPQGRAKLDESSASRPHQPAKYPRSRYQPTGTNKPGTHFPAITGENRPPGQCQPHNGPTRVN